MNKDAGSARTQRSEPTPIGTGAAENLRYIRNAIEASQTFTAVPAKGCFAMSSIAFAAALLETMPALASHWLALWIAAAALACVLALYFMESKARSLGLSLTRTVARRFFMSLAPAFVAGGILTLALADLVARPVITAVWLLMYGAGLTACGVFSVSPVLQAGLVFMALGTIALVLPATAAPTLLAAGFGGIHLALGFAIGRHHGG
jgi:hypothetical protein